MAYHVNPATGEPGLCRAKKSCPFNSAGEHFSSSEAARTFYEEVQEGKKPTPLSWLLSPKGEPIRGSMTVDDDVQALHEEYKELEAKTPSEVMKALRQYTLVGYERINEMLRGLAFSEKSYRDNDEMIAFTKANIAAIDEIFAKAPKKPRVVYRYVEVREGKTVNDFLEEYEQDSIVEELGFMSTSASVAYPAAYAKSTKDKKFVLLEIATDEGVSVQQADTQSKGDIQSLESEVLLPRNSRFEVRSAEKRKKIMPCMSEALKAHFFSPWSSSPVQMPEEFSLPVVKLVRI